ncbi:hypothetical protein CK203_044309 [Vitis vinifera]|uniref:Uncharacterized protein n=1 Tax=Vitis vinifera TaxID=29760 RepID=A0A438H831_VITVI|nr:hypothetical protein CK203_044309 [Vitis vinifera]
MHLKDKLSSLTIDNKSVSKYLQAIKCTVDELALINSPISDDNLIIYALKALEHTTIKEIVVVVRASGNLIIFKELHNKLVDHDFLH